MTNNNKPDIRELTLEHGISYPNDDELLMLILGSGVKDCSVKNLARKVSDAVDISDEETLIENLGRIRGMGKGRILAVAAAIEYGRRKTSCSGTCIRNARELLPFIKNFSIKNKEHFICVTLNGAHEIIQIHVVSVGTVNSTMIHPRDVFSVAIKENAAAMIVCHNHPSGNVEPSENDIKTTEKLIAASEIIGIPILDHIIIDSSSYYSFMDHGLLFTDS